MKRLVMLLILALLPLCGGACVSAEVSRTAVKLQGTLKVLEEFSRPASMDPDAIAAWKRDWKTAHEQAAALVGVAGQ